ncbi:16S rRNA (adenine(1518)-N(6)/adenine(1519)-N(6))-dimethyltransferase RsmA [Actinopolymorpha sp. B17G11]|uniref:16S rRNA (adenine(1518)-N(6)/adenine(1519)-N(6))- dimethyltransferase RsmA n=1 Tax=Actinopolymorpha sp. B17G11 TaxID=3160861 RepID=UPI0032E3A312
MSEASGATSAGPRLLGPAEVRALAGELGIRPTKQRGQNFVTDPNTVRRVVRTAGVGSRDVVLEIGPGLGSLTLALLDAVTQVVAVEIDEALAAALPRTVARFAPGQADRLSVVHADALQLTRLPERAGALTGPGAPTALVANLPYNVAVPVLLEVLAHLPSIQHGLVMVQLEVAERLAAAPGSKIYGIPSVKTAWYAQVRKVGLVGRTVFWPQPNVDSGLVAFTRRPPPSTSASRDEVFAVVDAAFGQRRKTLRSALAGLAGSPRLAEEALRSAGVDPADRGERLDVAAFARIAEGLRATRIEHNQSDDARTSERKPSR